MKGTNLSLSVPIYPEQARLVLGQDFVGVDEAKQCGISFTKEQRAYFAQIPISQEELETYRGTHMLLAMPSGSISDNRRALGVYRNVPALGVYRNVPEEHLNEAFAEAEKNNSVDWWLVRMVPITGVGGESWIQLRTKLPPDEVALPARVADYTLIIHKLVTGERLFFFTYAFCGDSLCDGRRVGIGYYFNGWPMHVYLGETRSCPDVGIISGRKICMPDP